MSNAAEESRRKLEKESVVTSTSLGLFQESGARAAGDRQAGDSG